MKHHRRVKAAPWSGRCNTSITSTLSDIEGDLNMRWSLAVIDGLADSASKRASWFYNLVRSPFLALTSISSTRV